MLFPWQMYQIRQRDIIPVFSGKTGCLSSWPDSCFEWYDSREPGKAGNKPPLSKECLIQIAAKMREGARNIDLANMYGVSPPAISAIRRKLGLATPRGRYV